MTITKREAIKDFVMGVLAEAGINPDKATDYEIEMAGHALQQHYYIDRAATELKKTLKIDQEYAQDVLNSFRELPGKPE